MLAKTMAFVNLRLARVAKCPGGYRIGQQFLERHHLRVPGPVGRGHASGGSSALLGHLEHLSEPTLDKLSSASRRSKVWC